MNSRAPIDDRSVVFWKALLGQAYIYSGRPKRALDVLKDAREHCEKLVQDMTCLCFIYGFLALAYWELGDPEGAAEDCYLEAKRLADVIGDRDHFKEIQKDIEVSRAKLSAGK